MAQNIKSKSAAKSTKVSKVAKDIHKDVIIEMGKAQDIVYWLLKNDPFYRFVSTAMYMDHPADEMKFDPDKVPPYCSPKTEFWFNAVPKKKGNWASLVSNPEKTGYPTLLSFLEGEYSAEGLLFYTACRELETYKDGDKYMYLTQFVKIYETFVLSEAPLAINISSSTNIALKRLYQKTIRALWDDNVKFISATAPPQLLDVMATAKLRAVELLEDPLHEDELSEAETDILECFKANCINLEFLKSNSGKYKIKFNQIFEEFFEKNLVDNLDLNDEITLLHGQFFSAVDSKKKTKKKSKK